MIRKNIGQIHKSTDSRASFIASTMSSDRYGDVVEQTWNLESFKSNPVILLNHRQDMLPIARAENVAVKNGQLEIDVVFDTGDELGAEVARKVKAGFMSAVSVGFQPGKSLSRAELPQEHQAFSQDGGMFFSDNELLEVSIVTIPANGEAIVTAKEYDMNNKNIRQMIRAELLALQTDELSKLKVRTIERQSEVEVQAPDGYHWMDYADGPVLMPGEAADHDGALSAYTFEVVEEHDPERMKQESDDDTDGEMASIVDQELDDEIAGYHDEEDSKDEEKAADQDEDDDQDKVKSLLEYLLSN